MHSQPQAKMYWNWCTQCIFILFVVWASTKELISRRLMREQSIRRELRVETSCLSASFKSSINSNSIRFKFNYNHNYKYYEFVIKCFFLNLVQKSFEHLSISLFLSNFFFIHFIIFKININLLEEKEVFSREERISYVVNKKNTFKNH